MSQPQKWWIGLIPLALFWIWVCSTQTGKFENDVAGRTMPAVDRASAQIGQAKINVKGRDVRISGTEIIGGAGAIAIKAAAPVPGVRLARHSLNALPVQKPYTFTAHRAGSKLVLDGFVPSPDLRAKMVAAAKAAAGSGGSVEDKMKYAGGAPSAFEALALAGVGYAGQLTAGAFSLSDMTGGLKGSVPDSATYETLQAAMKTLPGGGKTGIVNLVPPSAKTYQFGASHLDGKLVLSGLAPGLAVRAALNAAARAVPGVSDVEDRLHYASGAPDKFEDIAKTGLGLAGLLKSGQFSYRNGVADLSGEAPDSAAYVAAKAAMQKLPGGTRPGNVTVVPPAAKVYTFVAERTGPNIVLSGQVPSPQVREALNKTATVAAGNGRVIDRTAYASGAPADFQSIADYGIRLAVRLQTGSFSLSNNSASLQGDAPDSATYSELISGMGKLPSGARAARVDVNAPKASPYTFMAVRAGNGNAIVLRGNVPSSNIRTKLVAVARALGMTVKDDMTYASGAPAEFETYATKGIQSLAGLNSSEYSLTDSRFSLRGDAGTYQSYDAARLAVANFPRGLRPGRVNIRPPQAKPFVWSATRNGDTITLSGFVPDEVSVSELERRAKQLYPDGKVTNGLKVARGAPKMNFVSAATLGLKQLAALESGEAKIVDDELSVTGRAADQKRGDIVRRLPRENLPNGLRIGAVEVTNPSPKIAVPLPPPAPVVVPPTLKPNAAIVQLPPPAPVVVPPPPQPNAVVVSKPAPVVVPPTLRPNAAIVQLPPPAPVVVPSAPEPAPVAIAKPAKPAQAVAPAVRLAGNCQVIDGKIAQAEVYFSSDNIVMMRGGKDELSRIVEKAKQCPKAAIVLRGHADLRGDRRYNIRLSTRRTFTVKRALVRQGVDRKRLTTIGYGEDRPQADNRTFAGRAKNRRVDIILK